jgi:uncharacterized protein YeaO (DUF488 family)
MLEIMIRLKRAYDVVSAEDGTRILVDRLWPRGVSKEKIKVSEWMRDIGPSKELIKWFGHDPEKWAGFEKRYKRELRGKGDLIQKLRTFSRKDNLTLIYSAKDELHNQAIVIKNVLEESQ